MADWRMRAFHLAPDVNATLARFPFAILLTAMATAAIIAEINSATADTIKWEPVIGGLANAAVLAVAGKFFVETHPSARVGGLLLHFGLPLLVLATWQFWEWQWVRPYLFLVAAPLFLSISPVLDIGRTAAERPDVQDRFWWINQRAFTTAAVAAVGLGLIALGTLAIERSLDLLFGLSTSTLFYNWILPFAVFFLGPVYWLSTLPRMSEFDATDLAAPDFLTRAIGFLGQFILTPLLLIYALILLAYAAQIVITQTFPTGVIGWLVLTFVVTGAATWLVLHPQFLRERALVRLFHRTWFWLTVVPIALYAVAVWVRIDAYGFTTERVILVAGGAWAALVTAAFLIRLGDLRLIPGLAALVLVVISVGPWNFEMGPRLDQLSRLRSALSEAGVNGQATPNWQGDAASRARSAIIYLSRGDESIRSLDEMLAELNLAPVPSDARSPSAYFDRFRLPARAEGEIAEERGHLTRMPGPVDLTATPVYLGRVQFGEFPAKVEGGPALQLRFGELVVDRDTPEETIVPLAVWLAGQQSAIDQPSIRFTHDDRSYVLVVEELNLALGASAEEITYIDGLLFAQSEVTP
jgi:hypothetical protein